MRRVARGFSLIEVLLAIFVLGLGLLGLASIFPAVIAQQREAAGTVGAVSAAEAAETFLTSDAAVGLETILGEVGFGAFDGMADPPTFDTDGDGTPDGFDFSDGGWAARSSMLWQPGLSWVEMPVIPDDASTTGAATPLAAYTREGLVVLGTGDFVTETPIELSNDPLAVAIAPTDDAYPGTTVLPADARLHPAPYSGVTPRFVWDVALRRNGNNRVEAAIFVRSIDLGLDVPEGTDDGTPDGFPDQHVRFSDVLSRVGVGPLPDEAKRLAVGMDPSLLPRGSGAPVGASEAFYAIPLVAEARVAVDPSEGNRPVAGGSIVIVRAPTAWTLEDAGYRDSGSFDYPAGTGGGRPAWLSLLAQPGQRVVDNLGTVRRVLGEAEAGELPSGVSLAANELALRVSPSYTSTAARDDEAVGLAAVPLARRRGELFQFVFTSQVPEVVIVREVGAGGVR